MNRKGQYALIGLLFFFVTLVIFSILLEPLKEFINVGVNATTNMTHGTTIAFVLHYMPVLIVIVILIAGIMMILGRIQ